MLIQYIFVPTCILNVPTYDSVISMLLGLEVLDKFALFSSSTTSSSVC